MVSEFQNGRIRNFQYEYYSDKNLKKFSRYSLINLGYHGHSYERIL